MNGRCETDPLDRAVDVCDSCYGEFCNACLVLPKGRRHPICTHCTLALSGVRGHATVQVRGDRRTAKQRRAELAEAAATPSDDKVFRFFDADTEPAGAEAGDEANRRSRRPSRRDRRAKDTPNPGVAPLPLPAEVAAAVAARAATAGHGALVGTDSAGRADSEGRAEGPADPTELLTVTPAVARLEELRRQATPPASSPVPPVTEKPTPPTEEPTPRTEEPAETDAGPARRSGPPPKPSAGAAPPPRSDRRRPADADRTRLPPTAPMIGEVRTIGGRRSSDQPEPVEPGTVGPDGGQADDDDLVSVSEALSAVEQYDAGRPEPSGDGGSRKADTDDQGNWIPPILRGMAPDAREASTNLPQRRRG